MGGTNPLYKLVNKKAKYNHDKVIYRIYRDNELKEFKKTYLENKYSYEFRPIINHNNKYSNISSKYNKYKKNNNYFSENELRNFEIKIKNNDKYFTNNSIALININNNKNVKICSKKPNKRANKSAKATNWKLSLRTINNKKYLQDQNSKDNTFYINVYESMPWNEYATNNIFFNTKLRDILDIYYKYDKHI